MSIGADIPQIKRGMVWCTTCGRSERVDGGATLSGRAAGGWPKCCGYTMTIDSPEERIALTWRTDVAIAPAGVVVETKIDDGRGVRNEAKLKRSGRLWFIPDGSMYVYYTPTHWRPARSA